MCRISHSARIRRRFAMQICYGGSSACRSAQGRPECQAMLGRQRHDTASVHCTTPLDRSWVVRRVSTRQPPLHSHPCRCASSSGDSGESAADQRRRLEALFQAPSGESPAGAGPSPGWLVAVNVASEVTGPALKLLQYCLLRTDRAVGLLQNLNTKSPDIGSLFGPRTELLARQLESHVCRLE